MPSTRYKTNIWFQKESWIYLKDFCTNIQISAKRYQIEIEDYDPRQVVISMRDEPGRLGKRIVTNRNGFYQIYQKNNNISRKKAYLWIIFALVKVSLIDEIKLFQYFGLSNEQTLYSIKPNYLELQKALQQLIKNDNPKFITNVIQHIDTFIQKITELKSRESKPKEYQRLQEKKEKQNDPNQIVFWKTQFQNLKNELLIWIQSANYDNFLLEIFPIYTHILHVFEDDSLRENVAESLDISLEKDLTDQICKIYSAIQENNLDNTASYDEKELLEKIILFEQIAKEQNDQELLSFCLLCKTIYYRREAIIASIKRNDYDQAKIYLKKGLEAAKKAKNESLENSILLDLLHIKKKLNQNIDKDVILAEIRANVLSNDRFFIQIKKFQSEVALEQKNLLEATRHIVTAIDRHCKSQNGENELWYVPSLKTTLTTIAKEILKLIENNLNKEKYEFIERCLFLALERYTKFSIPFEYFSS